MAIDNIRALRSGHVFSVGNIYKCLRGLKNRNGMLFKKTIGTHLVTVRGRIRYVSDDGAIGLIDIGWFDRNFHMSGPEVQIKMEDSPKLLDLSRGDVIVVSGRVVNIHHAYSIVSMSDGVLHTDN